MIKSGGVSGVMKKTEKSFFSYSQESAELRWRRLQIAKRREEEVLWDFNTFKGRDGRFKRVYIERCYCCTRFNLLPNKWVTVLDPNILLEFFKQELQDESLISVESWFELTEKNPQKVFFILQKKPQEENNKAPQDFIVQGFSYAGCCLECFEVSKAKSWQTVIQIIQNTESSLTLKHLEQIILRQNSHQAAVKIEATSKSMNLFFQDEKSSTEFLAVIREVFPLKITAREFPSLEDELEPSWPKKMSIVVELPEIEIQDLVFLPEELGRRVGFPQILLCASVSKTIKLVSPKSGRVLNIQSEDYWKEHIQVFSKKSSLEVFVVLAIDTNWTEDNKKIVTIKPRNAAASISYTVQTHLQVNVGSFVSGYLLQELELPPLCDGYSAVVLVRVKNENTTGAKRIWRPKRIVEGLLEEDLDGFLSEVEQNPELLKDVLFVREEERFEEWLYGKRLLEGGLPLEEIMYRLNEACYLETNSAVY